MIDIRDSVDAVASRVHELAGTTARVLVAIAGPPASGKTTLAVEVARRLNAQRLPTAVVPMDGFHLDNALLDADGTRPRKGAAETFDAAGFASLVARLAAAQGDVVHPVFDRARDLSLAGAGRVGADVPVVLVEGNYLLHDRAPWSDLARHWTLSVRLEVPEAELRARLIQRWLSHNLSRAAAVRRAEANDLPNALSVIRHALPADLVL
ncbi:MAG: AAA family ATPase [Paracoccaceae bacterium]